MAVLIVGHNLIRKISGSTHVQILPHKVRDTQFKRNVKNDMFEVGSVHICIVRRVLRLMTSSHRGGTMDEVKKHV